MVESPIGSYSREGILATVGSPAVVGSLVEVDNLIRVGSLIKELEDMHLVVDIKFVYFGFIKIINHQVDVKVDSEFDFTIDGN